MSRWNIASSIAIVLVAGVVIFSIVKKEFPMQAKDKPSAFGATVGATATGCAGQVGPGFSLVSEEFEGGFVCILRYARPVARSL
jgi:hypothetical protein